MTIDIDRLRALIDVLVERDIAEFEHEADGVRTKIVRTPQAPPAPYPGYAFPAYGNAFPAAGNAAPAGGGASAGPAPAAVAAVDESSVTITSPFVGTFYRSPSPDAPFFVEVGSVIRPGQTLCIIEAMKLMNEIEGEHSGTVVEVLAQNGKAVEFGQPLFRIKKA